MSKFLVLVFDSMVAWSMLVIPVVNSSVPNSPSSSVHELDLLDDIAAILRSVPFSYDLRDPNRELRLTLDLTYCLYYRLAYELILVDAMSDYLYEVMWFWIGPKDVARWWGVVAKASAALRASNALELIRLPKESTIKNFIKKI